MTLPEVKLWTSLRQRPQGFKFRRQHPIGPYVLDFYCPMARLAIEVDGAVHGMGTNPGRDAVRDNWLGSEIVQTIRIPASDVLSNVDGIVRMIIERCVVRSRAES